MLVPRQGRRERSYREGTGATEDAGSGRAARPGGTDDVSSSLPCRVVVYHAAGCHLCERAVAQVRALRDELGFELEEVAIDGEAGLEARYRELIPVVEIDGEQVFTYYVHEAAFRRRLAAAQASSAGERL